MMKTVTYVCDLSSGNCQTKCPHGDVFVGSIACHNCQSFIADDERNKKVKCNYPYGKPAKSKRR